MKYIALFSGIGGFELAIRNLLPSVLCLGLKIDPRFENDKLPRWKTEAG